jgi:SNF2 family DNA or RNA helicase
MGFKIVKPSAPPSEEPTKPKKTFVIKKPNTAKPRKVLMPHQVEAIKYLENQRTKYGTGGCLFMEMRLGKTLSMIRFLLEDEKLKTSKVCVVAPATVCATWKKELVDDGVPESDILSIAQQGNTAKTRRRVEAFKGRWIIINYELSWRIKIGSYLRADDVVIADESLRIANYRSSQSKYLTNLPQRFKYSLCGSPAPEGKLQLFQQFKFARKRFLGFKDFWDFRSAFFEKFEHEYLPKKGAGDLIYQEMHAKAFCLTRNQAGIGPKKLYSQRNFGLSPKQAQAYSSMLYDFEWEGVETKFVVAQINYLAQIASGFSCSEDHELLNSAKLDELELLLKEDLKDEQVIVWTNFRHENLAVSERLKGLGISYDCIHGDVPLDQREKIRLSFHKGSIRVVVMQLATGKVGLDFSCASTAIYYSNSWSGDTRLQSEDRVVHMLGTEPRLLIDFVTTGTVDEYIHECVVDKKIDANALMGKLQGFIIEQKAKGTIG